MGEIDGKERMKMRLKGENEETQPSVSEISQYINTKFVNFLRSKVFYIISPLHS